MLEILRHGSRELLHNNNNCFVGEKKNDDGRNFSTVKTVSFTGNLICKPIEKRLITDFLNITTPIRCFVTENCTLELKPFFTNIILLL